MRTWRRKIHKVRLIDAAIYMGVVTSTAAGLNQLVRSASQATKYLLVQPRHWSLVTQWSLVSRWSVITSRSLTFRRNVSRSHWTMRQIDAFAASPACRQTLFFISCLFRHNMAFFCARQHLLSALYAIARLSICPSVRPSHGWISRKRLNLGWCNFHHTVAPSLSCLRYKFHPEIPTGTGSPERGRQTRVVGETS